MRGLVRSSDFARQIEERAARVSNINSKLFSISAVKFLASFSAVLVPNPRLLNSLHPPSATFM